VILSAVKFQVLTNGIEVKLQRNALSVIEPPTGNEEDDKFDCENMQWNSSDMGKILGCYFFFSFQSSSCFNIGFLFLQVSQFVFGTLSNMLVSLI